MFNFWQKWLNIVCIIITIFGMLMALLSGTSIFTIFNHQINPAFWGKNIPDITTQQFQHWLYGVWGATIAGWGLVLGFITNFPFKKKERWSWYCIAIGLLVWFILDTTLSINYEVYFNVVFNAFLLILAGLPLFFTRKELLNQKNA